MERLTEHNSIKTKPTATVAEQSSANNAANEKPAATPSSSGAVSKQLPLIVARPKTFAEKIAFASVITLPNSYLQSMELASDQVMQYEDEILLAQGRSLIPVERLTTNALTKLRTIQKAIRSGTTGATTTTESCFTDLLLVELANWFNTEFFSWVNSLPCDRCGNEDIQTRGGFVDAGVRVEVCESTCQFYNYITLAIILQFTFIVDIYLLQQNVAFLSL